jgi:MoaA/NifB/PqqE/SkfB family radical SAM enzyme
VLLCDSAFAFLEKPEIMRPILLHYYITNRCNSRCVFCSIWKEQPKVDAAITDVLRNLTEARRAGCRFVDFTGGEPLLHPHLDLFLKKAKECGFVTSVTTNCILFKQHAPKLRGLIDLLHFSIDADNEALHNEVRGADSFASVVESIPIALANDLVPDLLFTYSDRNIDAFDGVYEIARKNKLILILDPVFETTRQDKVSWETHRKALAYAKRPGVYCNKAHISLRKQGGNHASSSLCRAVSTTLVVLATNELALPCFHHAFSTIPLSGSLSHALLQPERQDALAKQGAYPFCEGCHINCYFDPSYLNVRSILYIQSLSAKISYAMTKYFLYKRPFPWGKKTGVCSKTG